METFINVNKKNNINSYYYNGSINQDFIIQLDFSNSSIINDYIKYTSGIAIIDNNSIKVNTEYLMEVEKRLNLGVKSSSEYSSYLDLKSLDKEKVKCKYITLKN